MGGSWGNDDDDFSLDGAFGGAFGGGGGGGFGGNSNANKPTSSFAPGGNKASGFGKGSGFGGNKSNLKQSSYQNNSYQNNNSSSSYQTPRPTVSFTKKEPRSQAHGQWANSLNKMISVHNMPFFGSNQAFFGRTLIDWIRKPRAQFSDFIDRLNCYYVPTVLFFFVMFISANIFGFGTDVPMRCLRSQELKENDEYEYALDYCFSKNQYYVAPEEGIPWPNTERRARQLGYYHWVPIMLLLQAILFYLPNWMWHHLNQQSGIEFAKFIEEATRMKSLSVDDPTRQELSSHLSEKIGEAVLQREFFHKRFVGCRVGHSMGTFVSLLYVGIKTLYLANVVAQFFVLNAFIGRDYRWWGLDVLRALLNGENWQDSPVFPRLTLCDVPIRRLGDTPRYTLQCHLRINTYNEKIYLFIWWGLLAVAALTICNFFYYLIVLVCLPCTQENSVRHLLKQVRHKDVVYSDRKKDRRLIKRFAEHALRKDGVLLFWFIESHAGAIVARELMGNLFDVYNNEVETDDDPSDVLVKKGKGSYSSQSTGTLDDEDPLGFERLNKRFANGAMTPSAPPKFPPDSNSFDSLQEQNLVDGNTPYENATPKQPLNGRPQHHHKRMSHQYYDRSHRPSLMSRVFGRIGASVMGTPNQYSATPYYDRPLVKNV